MCFKSIVKDSRDTTEVLGKNIIVADTLQITCKKHLDSRNQHGSIVTCDYAAIAIKKHIVETGREVGSCFEATGRCVLYHNSNVSDVTYLMQRMLFGLFYCKPIDALRVRGL